MCAELSYEQIELAALEYDCFRFDGYLVSLSTLLVHHIRVLNLLSISDMSI